MWSNLWPLTSGCRWAWDEGHGACVDGQRHRGGGWRGAAAVRHGKCRHCQLCPPVQDRYHQPMLLLVTLTGWIGRLCLNQYTVGFPYTMFGIQMTAVSKKWLIKKDDTYCYIPWSLAVIENRTDLLAQYEDTTYCMDEGSPRFRGFPPFIICNY